MGNKIYQNLDKNKEIHSDGTAEHRFVHFNDDSKESDPSHIQCTKCNPQTIFIDNYVKTTKYSIYSFIPLNLYEQFHKIANIYFLLDAILSTTEFSPKTPLVTIFPLVFVLGVTALKDAIEDYNRYQMDIKVNGSICDVWNKEQMTFIPTLWKDVKVGELIMVHANESFPTDMILLKSNDPIGSCAIQTANLDGETNLKMKQAVQETYSIECNQDGTDYPLKLPPLMIQSSAPNLRLDDSASAWAGNMAFLDHDNTHRISLSTETLLLRGCTLRNNKWIVGLSIFTGNDTKVMLNQKESPFKRSSVDRLVGKFLYLIFLFQFSLNTFASIALRVWLDSYALKHWYLPYAFEKFDFAKESGLNWLTFIVLLDVLVPISLYVSIEYVKFFQAYLIEKDIDIYYEVNDIPTAVRCSNLNEELGQITHIFSDKTGTLTCNMMEFYGCSLANGEIYGDFGQVNDTDILPSLLQIPNIPPINPKRCFRDNRIMKEIVNEGTNKTLVNNFLTCCAVCHSVVPDFPNCTANHDIHLYHDNCDDIVQFNAASPDEKCLVEFACDCRYYLYYRHPLVVKIGDYSLYGGEELHVNILGTNFIFEVLEIFPFESSRARMSIIVRDPRDGLIKLFCKGADTKMLPLLGSQNKDNWTSVDSHLTIFGKKGLRTLVLAYRVITEKEFLEWWPRHLEAKASIENRDENVAKSITNIEAPGSLTLLGATAIEDKLQDGVPSAIQKLLQANISVWMLTGDKTETAVNIGKSCNLISPIMMSNGLLKLEIVTGVTDLKEYFLGKLHEYYQLVTNNPFTEYALVVTGSSLLYIFQNDGQTEQLTESQSLFLKVCTSAKSIICCRTSPAQKADIVLLVKKNIKNCVTCAVGDGANDVSMIKAAHVGIGISGLEGLQAVMASDFAIGQFRFLQQLIIVHGQWCYHRISYLILYSFYKNVCLVLNNIWFAFYSAFNGQIYFDPWTAAAYNVLFTGFPIMFAGVFNQHVSKPRLLKYPGLYKDGQERNNLNYTLLFLYIFGGILQSLLLYFVSNLVFGTIKEFDGLDRGQWMASGAMFMWLILLVNIQVSIHMDYWTKYHFILMFFQFPMYIYWVLIYSIIPGEFYFVGYRLLASPDFWFWSILLPLTANLPEIIYKFVQRNWFPRPVDIISEKDRGYNNKIDINSSSSNFDDNDMKIVPLLEP